MKKWVFLCGCAFAFELLPVAASAAPAVEIPGVPWTSLKAVSGKKGETVDILDGSGRCVLAFHVQPSKAKIAQALKVAVREDCLEFDLRGAFKAGARSVRLGSLDLDPKDCLGRDLALVSVFKGSEGACATGLAVPGGELGERKKYWDVRGPHRRILPVPTRLESSTLVPTNLTALYVKNDFTSPGDGPIRYYGTRLGSADILTDEPPVRHEPPKTLFSEPADKEMSGVRTYPVKGNLDPLRGAISLWMKRRKPASGVFFELCPVFPDGRAAKAGDGALRFGWNADRIFWERGDYAESAFSPVSALTPFKADVWQHYVLTWDELGCSVYIDGKPVPPAKTSDSLNPVKRALWKAQKCVFRDGWKDVLRTFRVEGETRGLEVWSAPLSRAQVRERFAALTHAPQGENGWSAPWRNPAGAPPPNVALGSPAKVAGVPEGMRLVADVSAADIARGGDTNVFRSTGSWKIGTCAGVDYLEAGPAQFDRFALRFTFEKTASLVCFEVTYPDDKARATEVTVVNAAAPYSDWGLQQGIETGLEHPVTGTNATKRFLYWPNGTGGDRKNDLGLTVMTIDDGCPAAISRVRAYVVDPARLPPAAPVARTPVAGRSRRFAIRFEDPAVVKDFGKGQLTLEDARVSIDRLAAYIRFTGADTFIYPGVWYAGPIGDDYMPRIHQPHYLREFCRRFQRDGIGFVPSINQQWFPEIEDGITPRTMTDGSLHASPISILSTGCPNWGGWHFTPTYYNIAHPLVQESLMREVDRLVAECGDYASFKGVCLDLFNSINVGWWGSLDAGYNDYAIDEFVERLKGLKGSKGLKGLEGLKGSKGLKGLEGLEGLESVDRTVPLRGREYARIIKGDPVLCEKWIAWRCDVLTDFYRRLVERIRAKRGDLELWVSAAPPWRPNMVDRPDLDDPQVAGRMLREAGIDGRKLAKIPHLNLGILSMPSWWHDELHRTPARDGLREKVRDLPETPGFYAPARETDYPFALFHDSYYESSVGSSPSRRGRQRDGRLNGGWLLETPWRVSAFNASGREALRPYAKALADGDMMAYAKGGYVIGTLGTEDVLAPWMREFRSLPAVKFEDVAGDWPKAVKLRRAVVGGQTWHYVVNTGFDGVTATLPAPVGKVSLQGYELKAIPPAERAALTSCEALAVPRHILVRDFRTIKDGKVVCFNIGTAAHGPATLAVLEKHLPGTKLSVWADAPLFDELRRLMARRFPDVRIHTGPEVPDTDADLFLVSSGSTVAGSVQRSIGPWRKQTGRPVAAYAIGYSSGLGPLMRSMAFCFYRDKTALSHALEAKDAPKVTGFAPDAVFDFDASDDAGAAEFLKRNGLEKGRFVCAIPGERHTARWTYFGGKPNGKKAAENAAHERSDNAVVCAAIVESVRKYGLKVLLCAEQRSEMPLVDRALYAQLPEDVRASCVRLKEFWSPDLALGVYRQSRCVFGIEMHSQVMAVGNGVPAVVMRHAGFGSKSDMWKDIGLGDWLMDIDDPGAKGRAVAIVGGILADETAARAKVAAARTAVDRAAGQALSALARAVPADFPPGGLDVGFALNLARPGVPPVTVTPETVSSRSVERRGGTTVVTWRGHPVCGPDFAAVAELTPQDGGWAWTFRYAGNADETRDVESVDFPVLEAPRSDRTGIVYPKSLGLEEHPDWTALKPGASVVSAKPISFRFIAACDGSANGLYLDERGARGFAGTLRAENGCKPGTVRLAARHDLAVTPASNRAFALPYGGTFRTFAGTWYDAAQIYRAWVKDQPWVVANRGKDRTKLRDIALWLWQRGLSEDVVAPAERFLDETGLRPAVDWYWWHKIPYDTQYPFFWPPREGEAAFRAAVARMKRRGIFSQVYTNGMSWDCDDPSWTTGGGREEVRYEKRGGEFLSRMYNVFTKHRLAHLCGEAPKFQAHFVDLAGTLAACGLDGLYMDQIGCGSLGSCWNPAHAHAPGGGRVVSDGYRALFRRIRAANPDLLLSTEEPNEEFLGEVDDVICLWQNAERFVKRGRQSCEPVPVYQALHHGETTLFGSFAILGGRTAWDPTWPEASRWRDEAAWDARHFSTDQFALEFVRGIVFGNQPCLHNLTLGQIADPRLADDWRFVKETAAFYHANRDFLFDGRLLSPGRLTCERIAFDFVVRGTYTTEETLAKVKTESPAVLHSLWQAPDGRKALVLVNWTRQEQRFALETPDVATSGMLAARRWKLISFTDKETK